MANDIMLTVIFLKDLSETIMGSDLKPYGPFKAGDVSSLPRENVISLAENGYCRLATKMNERELTFLRPMSLEELQNILGVTIKHDVENKTITFLCMLTAYTEDSQFNISFRAPSSTGKSYIPIEISQFFPKDDIIEIAYSSPTSFYHDGKWDEYREVMLMNFERKIIIFLDQPHDQLLQKLRPLLSHDKKELLYKITDKSEKKGLRTKNVIIIGYCSAIFCTGNLRIEEQEATRNFVLSPETTIEKIREGLFLKGYRKGNPPKFQEYLDSHPEKELLKERVQRIKEANIKKIIITNVESLVNRFIGEYPKIKPRHQRDIERLISLVQAFAMLNFPYRNMDENNNIFASEEDIENAFRLYKSVAESQELGIAPYIYRLFKEVIEPLFIEINEGSDDHIGLERKQITQKHYEVYGRPIADWFLRQQILPALESAGLIYQEKDPNDGRKFLVFVYTPQSNSRYIEKYSEPNSGVNI